MAACLAASSGVYLSMLLHLRWDMPGWFRVLQPRRLWPPYIGGPILLYGIPHGRVLVLDWVSRLKVRPRLLGSRLRRWPPPSRVGRPRMV